MQPPASLTVGSVGLGKVNPITAKLANIGLKLASSVGNTTAAMPPIVYIFETLILFCAIWQLLLRRPRTLKKYERGSTVETCDILLHVSYILGDIRGSILSTSNFEGDLTYCL